MQKALDAAVVKQGVFTLVFHPHKWIRSEQLVELVDHAVTKHGPKIKFLNFREAQERLNKHLLAGQPLRSASGGDNGVRLLDLDRDGYQDVVIGNGALRQTRLWSPRVNKWITSDFPAILVAEIAGGGSADAGARFGVVRDDGHASLIMRSGSAEGAWHFDGREWVVAPELLAGLELNGKPVLTVRDGKDAGVRLRDLDGDGRCECIVGGSGAQAVFSFTPGEGWKQLPYALPPETRLVDEQGRDAGLRFVDIDQDGRDDVLFSDDAGYGAWLFDSPETGWSRKLVAGARSDAKAIPPIVRGGTNNGAWVHGRHLYVQNESTDKLPDVVDRLALDDLLADVRFPGPKSPEQSLAVMHARPGFQVELAAAEPLVRDPVAMAFGPDGRLWVVEMGDYPRRRRQRGPRWQGARAGRSRWRRTLRPLDRVSGRSGLSQQRDALAQRSAGHGCA